MSVPPKSRSPRQGGLGKYNSTEKGNDIAVAPTPQQPGYFVIESKSSGREVAVGRYDDYLTARSVVKLLKWAGAPLESSPRYERAG